MQFKNAASECCIFIVLPWQPMWKALSRIFLVKHSPEHAMQFCNFLHSHFILMLIPFKYCKWCSNLSTKDILFQQTMVLLVCTQPHIIRWVSVELLVMQALYMIGVCLTKHNLFNEKDKCAPYFILALPKTDKLMDIHHPLDCLPLLCRKQFHFAGFI